MKSFKQYLIPSLIANLFMSTYVIIDGIFIGYNLNDLGLAAINIAWPITAILQSFGLALGISGGIYLSRKKALGFDEYNLRIKATILIYILLISLILGIILFLLKDPLLTLFQAKGDTFTYANKYITIILYGSVFQVLGLAIIPLNKNIGYVKLSMIASLSSTIVNFILDYLFIAVLKYGLEGAAVASVIGAFSCFLIGIIPYLKNIKKPIFDKEVTKELFLGAIAPFILSYSYSILIIITNALSITYGGNEACAAYTVLSYLLYVINALATGTSDSIQPLFSYNNETKDYKKNNKLLLKTIGISFILVVIFNISFLFLKEPITRLYGLSVESSKIYNDAFIYYFVGFLFISISKCICSYLYATNQKVIANIFVLVEPLALTPLFYFILLIIFNLNGLWISFMIVQILLSLLLSITILLIWRKKDGRIFNRRQAKGNNEPECL